MLSLCISLWFYAEFCILTSLSFAAEEVNLSTSDIKVDGLTTDARVGSEVFALGDINGDKIDDFAICALNHDGVAKEAGVIGIFFGKTSTQGWPMNLTLNNADVLLYGDNSGDYAGFHIAGKGDINGDGIGDIAIAAPNRDELVWDDNLNDYVLPTDNGEIYVILGRPLNEWPTSAISLENFANGSFIAPFSNTYLARVAINGDFNGDGVDDIAIGVPTFDADGQHKNVGKIYVICDLDFYTLQQEVVLEDDIFNNNDFHYVGTRDEGTLGASLTFIDFNHDGVSELAVGEPGYVTHYNSQYFYTGAVNIFKYSNQSIQLLSVLPCDIHYYWIYMGGQVANVGDVNNDGFPDLMALGSANYSYIYSGLIKGNQDFSKLKMSDILRLGYYMSGCAKICPSSDVNEDGFSDILVSTYGTDHYHYKEDGSIYYVYNSQAYLVYGNPTGWANETNISTIANVIYVPEEGANNLLNNYSLFVAVAGDIDGNKNPDILLGAPGHDFQLNNDGRAYLFLAEGCLNQVLNPSATEGTTSWKYYGNAVIGTEVSGNKYFSLPKEGDYFMQEVAIPAGTLNYHIQAQMKCANTSVKEGFPYLYIELKDVNGKTIKNLSTYSTESKSTSWKLVQKDYTLDTTTASKVVKAKVWLKRSTYSGANDTNTASFDDVTLNLDCSN